MIDITVQDILKQEIETDSTTQTNDMVQALTFLKNNGVSLTNKQIRAMLKLQAEGMHDIAEQIFYYKSMKVNKNDYFKMIDKFTMADRIKGTAKLKDILKAQVPNPNNDLPNAKDVTPQPLRERELDR